MKANKADEILDTISYIGGFMAVGLVIGNIINLFIKAKRT